MVACGPELDGTAVTHALAWNSADTRRRKYAGRISMQCVLVSYTFQCYSTNSLFCPPRLQRLLIAFYSLLWSSNNALYRQLIRRAPLFLHSNIVRSCSTSLPTTGPITIFVGSSSTRSRNYSNCYLGNIHVQGSAALSPQHFRKSLYSLWRFEVL